MWKIEVRNRCEAFWARARKKGQFWYGRKPETGHKIPQSSSQNIGLQWTAYFSAARVPWNVREPWNTWTLELFKHDFGEFSKLSPSFHRAVAHSGEVARYFQAQGFTIGELSECAQEAINAPTKKDVAQFSFRGSHKNQNLGCLKRNWAFSDPLTLEYAE